MAVRTTKLTVPQKHFIVTSLAVYKAVSEIKKEFAEQFGEELNYQLIRRYDPSYVDYRGGRELTALFDATRSRFIEEVAAHPAAHKSFRIARLGKMADTAYDRGNYPLAAKLLEQVAREVGGAFTNEVNVKGSIRHTVKQAKVEELPPEEQRIKLANEIAEAFDRLAEQQVH